MKHIETSKLVTLAEPVDAASVKYSLVQRLRSAFHVETVGEGDENFRLTAMGRGTPYHCTLNVIMKVEPQRARIMIEGDAAINASTKALYALGVLVLLVLGLFPGGTINTSGKGSAMDIMVFLFLGIFVLYDVGKKLAEPEVMLDRILRAVETEFGK